MPQTGFFVRVRGKVSGPYETEGLRRLIRQGMLARFHEISADRATWTSAGDYEELFPAPSIPEEAFVPVPPPQWEQQDYNRAVTSGEPAFYAAAPPPLVSDLPDIPRPNLPPPRSRAPKGPNRLAENHRSLALAALILTLAGGILAPLSIVCATMALNGMRRTGSDYGRGMAITALVLGIFETVGMIVAGAILIAIW
jgi:hypothetical protein